MRPLLITDCDEVLLHMVSHFADWLSEAHALAFDLDELGAIALADQRGKAPSEPHPVHSCSHHGLLVPPPL